ncbi:MAG: nuclease [Desulfobulbaceae bacterium]|nr:nuclease [Desulfobulbaceae bacterium]
MRLIFLIFFLLIHSVSHSQNLVGKVISVADGDTITILDNKYLQTKIRLYGIDTPEKGQPFGKAAKRFTSKLTYKKKATIKRYDTDKYGRTVGVVFVDGINVNAEILKAGFAWQYRKYCKASFCEDWILLEKEARKSQVGLWKGVAPVSPWKWRKGARNSSYSKSNTGKYGDAGTGFHGNIKSHVFHSSSCRHFNCKNCIESFYTRKKAIAAGYRPCGGCKP